MTFIRFILFLGCCGALDGILVHVVTVTECKPPIGVEEEECFQNVPAICDLDMMVTFVLAGWKG